jgi:hypothetical protein
MILFKISATITIVTGLSIVAERVSPRAAGILSGYPAGSAIALFFIGLEQGAGFAGKGAPYNVAGLTGTLVLLLVYYLVSARVRRFTIPAASAAGIGAFFATIGLLNALLLPPWAGVALTTAAIPCFHFLFRAIPNAQIDNRVRLGARVLLFRAAVSALIVVAVTGVAHLVEPSQAGLFSAFPATAYPLLLIVHLTYGTHRAHTVVKNMPQGLGSLVVYSLTVAAAYPRLGITWGTLLAFATASAYLALLAALSQRRSTRPAGAH